ncbi:MAG: iron ABC transporter permease [Candidatus Bipolaricaulota bacterium]|nr:iron ABC transporter permease [Candidatus Bipolaricaulota bacterium]
MTLRRGRRALWILIPAAAALFLVSLVVGRYGVRPIEALRALLGADGSEVLRALILRVRLPRTIAAACVGANLAVSGAVLQGLFRNPLVDGKVLGVSSGAAFGAALALSFAGGAAAVQGLSFLFAIAAVALVAWIGWRFGAAPLVLVVAGIAVSALFDALIGLIKYVADPLSRLPAITYWLLGGLSASRWETLIPVIGVTVVGLTFFLLFSWRLNLLTLSEAEAASLGLHVRPLRIVVIGAATVLIAVAVSISGMIGWIGLVVPHVARAWVGADHERLIPASAVLGAATLIGLDTIARTVLPSEIPLGILTGLIGIPAFLLLFLRLVRSRGAER